MRNDISNLYGASRGFSATAEFTAAIYSTCRHMSTVAYGAIPSTQFTVASIRLEDCGVAGNIITLALAKPLTSTLLLLDVIALLNGHKRHAVNVLCVG